MAEAVARLVDRGEADGKTYELGGPEVLTFKQLMQFTLNTIGRKQAADSGSLERRPPPGA